MSNSNNANKKKAALGRGLGALLQNPATDITTSKGRTEAAEVVVGSVALISIKQIETNPFQPRTQFEAEALSELAESIRVHGIIQPVTVRKMGYDHYQLISGERRFRASQLAGLTQIPAYIRIANDQAMLEMALVENIQRENLDAIEVAISYKRLIDECNLTQEQLSEKVAKQRSTVTNYLRLLKLPERIQLAIRDGKISMGHARALLAVENKEKQIKLFEQVVEDDLSVRATEMLARGEKPPEPKPIDTSKTKSGVGLREEVALSPAHRLIRSHLGEYFNADVQLSVGSNGKGKITIPFGSDDDLQIILDLLNIES
jgi:ParB family chromosome partitioning protein